MTRVASHQVAVYDRGHGGRVIVRNKGIPVLPSFRMISIERLTFVFPRRWMDLRGRSLAYNRGRLMRLINCADNLPRGKRVRSSGLMFCQVLGSVTNTFSYAHKVNNMSC